jgi:hypothetical protein
MAVKSKRSSWARSLTRTVVTSDGSLEKGSPLCCQRSGCQQRPAARECAPLPKLPKVGSVELRTLERGPQRRDLEPLLSGAKFRAFPPLTRGGPPLTANDRPYGASGSSHRRSCSV